MSEYVHYDFLTTLIQTIGIMLVAGLLLPMTRAMPGQFLWYWSCGWMCQAIALLALFGAFHFPAARTPFLIGREFAEYLFGFAPWAGCREVTTGRSLRPAHLFVVAPFGVYAVASVVTLGGITRLCPFHDAAVGTLFFLALATTRGYQTSNQAQAPATGLWVVRGALLGLGVLFWHYAAVTAYTVYDGADHLPGYIAFSPVYEVLLDVVLAFGMVVLAADRMRDALEAKNRQLAAATEELAAAARTDALTGLLNRRAFDELVRENTGKPFSGSIAVLDMNNLKPLNDTHGHASGDVALQLVARALRVHFRVTDPIFRTGDEFAVVMVGCGESDLRERMTRLDDALLGQRLPGVSGAVNLGLAWGVAGFTETSELPAAVVQADEAMYAAKRQRKVAPPVPEMAR